MPKYIAHVKTWLGHENRMVEPGEEFETTFPDGMKLSGNIELIEPKPTRTRTRKTVTETEVETDQVDEADGESDTADTETPDTEAGEA